MYCVLSFGTKEYTSTTLIYNVEIKLYIIMETVHD